MVQKPINQTMREKTGKIHPSTLLPHLHQQDPELLLGGDKPSGIDPVILEKVANRPEEHGKEQKDRVTLIHRTMVMAVIGGITGIVHAHLRAVVLVCPLEIGIDFRLLLDQSHPRILATPVQVVALAVVVVRTIAFPMWLREPHMVR
ncbi:hypothetical protein C8R45DRAFT_1109878 [Mycena sanguinolenta]|nr:hypothetical protein C8R45DRAFT_1109878 [Mycena sanguinolenta]